MSPTSRREPASQGAGKKKIRVTKNVDGHPVDVEIEVDDVAGPTWPPRNELKLLDHDLLRVDAPEKVTGRARYTHDMRLPGMVFARFLCSPYPSVKVAIDTAPALAIPGVEAALALQDSTRFLGQAIAVVAARTPELCDDALRALRVTYTHERWAVDREQATAEGAPAVRKDGNLGKPGTTGDADEALAALEGAAAVVEATYSVPVQHHACLETHGVVVDYRGGEEATIYASTQATFSIAGDAARELGLKANQVTAIVEYMGGGFGAKFGLGQEGLVACRLAKQLRKPVHLLLTRSDEFVMGGNRSGARATMKGGVAANGRLVAIVSDVQRLGGIGDGSFARHPYIYAVEKPFAKLQSVYTHTDSNRAMRAPGHPQSSFIMESLIDELAYKIELDPLELRKKNLRDPAYARQLDRVAHEIGWAEHANKTKPGRNDGGVGVGIGFAISTWGAGGNNECEVDVKIDPDGSVTATVGSQDLGTGTRTYVAAITAEEFGLQVRDVTARIGSSQFPRANGSGGSTTVPSLAPSVKNAAWKAKNAFAAIVAPVLKTAPELVRFEAARIFDHTDPARALTWKQACALLKDEGLTVRGGYVPELASQGVHGALAAKVAVDTLTGRVQVLRMVGIQDCGMPLNRLAVRSQHNGGMVQALSYGLLEERVIDPKLGLCFSDNFEGYKLAHALEIPEMLAIIDDGDTRRAVTGMAEPAVIPGHGAIANAVFNACGARVRDLPLTPDKVLAALGRV